MQKYECATILHYTYIACFLRSGDEIVNFYVTSYYYQQYPCKACRIFSPYTEAHGVICDVRAQYL